MQAQGMNIDAVVISLRRTPERLMRFQQLNQSCSALIRTVEGIDGQDLAGALRPCRLIDKSALDHWTPGAIGAALSHLRCWRQCAERGQPMLVVEDDAVLAHDWQAQLNQLCSSPNLCWDVLLLGWNYNSVLHHEDATGMRSIELFEPAYPDLNQIKKIIAPGRVRKLDRLKHAFGLPAYLIHPKAAEHLLEVTPPLRSEALKIGRGIPVVQSSGVDGLLNFSYEEMKSWVIKPPLAVALNDPSSSLTQAKTSFGN
jgi:glycosyl transferase family 25